MRNQLLDVVEEILHFNLVYMMLVIGSGITELRLSTLNVTSNICQPHRIKKSLLKSNYTCSVFDLERNELFHVVEEILLFDSVYRMLVIGAGITELRGLKINIGMAACRNRGLSEFTIPGPAAGQRVPCYCCYVSQCLPSQDHSFSL